MNQGEIVAGKEIAEIRGNMVLLKNGMDFSIGRTYRQDILNMYFGTQSNDTKKV